jgi:hypothetical protein
LRMQGHSYQIINLVAARSMNHVDLTCLLGSDADVGERAWDLSFDDEMIVHHDTLQHFLVLYSPGETPSIPRNLSKHKGTTLHFELTMAERRHVLCGVGGDRTHAGRRRPTPEERGMPALTSPNICYARSVELQFAYDSTYKLKIGWSAP